MPRKRTRYQDLEIAGQELTQAEVFEAIRQLARDERFAAVVTWLKRSEAAWAMRVGATENAGDHGKLASMTGSMGALIRLQTQLSEILRKSRETPSPSPAD